MDVLLLLLLFNILLEIPAKTNKQVKELKASKLEKNKTFFILKWHDLIKENPKIYLKITRINEFSKVVGYNSL